MAITDRGLIMIGSFLKGDSTTRPLYGVMGVATGGFDGTKYHLGSEIPSARKSLSWAWNGNDAVATFIILPNEANGSTINEIGISDTNSSLGSDLWTRNVSAIGDKTSDFGVTVDVRWRNRRA